jgi:hypothetical protein
MGDDHLYERLATPGSAEGRSLREDDHPGSDEQLGHREWYHAASRPT